MIRTGQSRDSKRYEAMREIGCVACLIAGARDQCGPVTMHHLVDKGYRKHSGGNQATIPLGEWHHQGKPFIDRTGTWMRNAFGPSMFYESKEFARVYGSQRELLAKVNALLAEGKMETAKLKQCPATHVYTDERGQMTIKCCKNEGHQGPHDSEGGFVWLGDWVPGEAGDTSLGDEQ